jgi:hypothetical protein
MGNHHFDYITKLEKKKKKKLIYNSTNHSIDQMQRSMQSCVNVSHLVSH